MICTHIFVWAYNIIRETDRCFRRTSDCQTIAHKRLTPLLCQILAYLNIYKKHFYMPNLIAPAASLHRRDERCCQYFVIEERTHNASIKKSRQITSRTWMFWRCRDNCKGGGEGAGNSMEQRVPIIYFHFRAIGGVERLAWPKGTWKSLFLFFFLPSASDPMQTYVSQ